MCDSQAVARNDTVLSVRLGTASQTHLDGFRFRPLRGGAVQPQVRRMYATVWEQLVGNAAGLHSIVV